MRQQTQREMFCGPYLAPCALAELRCGTKRRSAGMKRLLASPRNGQRRNVIETIRLIEPPASLNEHLDILSTEYRLAKAAKFRLQIRIGHPTRQATDAGFDPLLQYRAIAQRDADHGGILVDRPV